MDKAKIKRPMKIMLICLAVLFGGIFIYKLVMHILFMLFMSSYVPKATVSTAKADFALWQSTEQAVASLRSIRGVNVTTELAGMVKTIYFSPGADVEAGAVLVQLRADSDIAQLQALQASAELAKINFERDKAQYAVQAVSKAAVDTDAANLKNLTAQVAQQQAIVNKKTIRAPFAGRVGVSLINPGQFISPGDKIVSLQTFDPIYADFNFPQQILPRLKLNQEITYKTDSFPNRSFKGKITTIDPAIDTATRNVLIEATLANPSKELVPGMFGRVEVIVGTAKEYITVPVTAVAFNPYGEVIFLVRDGKDKKGKKILTAHQVFVTTGETRGNEVKVLKGLQKGDLVVTTGQLQLKNGMQVEINNTIKPTSVGSQVDETEG
ncbi:MAG: efflux RND transporter periplasmic adaptor subunit [Gammaproteobacteria bacterium]|nr:efflux RND transporter periplasmic adaptor subunit [Gammaproteobacteria bacterium]